MGECDVTKRMSMYVLIVLFFLFLRRKRVELEVKREVKEASLLD